MVDEHVRFEYLGNNRLSDVPISTLVALSTIAHGLLFYFLSPSLTPLIKSYIVSTVHAVVCVLSVLNYFVRYSVDLKQLNRIAGGGVYGTGDEMMVYSICYSFGYFTYDFLLMLSYKSVRTRTALIHHVIVLAGLSSGLFARICHPCHFYLLLEELSTIPLNLKTMYRHRARLHQIFSYLFVLCFLLSRLTYGTIICGYAFRGAPRFLHLAVSQEDWTSVVIGLFQAALCLLTRALNFYWSVLIIHKFLYPKPSKSKSS